jgi:biopolymer transport protein ExbB
MLLLLAQAAAEKPWYRYGALGYMIDGGEFMWPILLLGILAAGVLVERYRSLKMLSVDTKALRQRVMDLLQADRGEEALALCEKERGPVPAILSAGLRKYVVLKKLNYDGARVEEQVIKAMEDYAVHIVAAMEKHLPILATVSSVAPMLGFLGTVQGMVISFAEIVDKRRQGSSEDIVLLAAGGIMVALLTTVFGLVVGIPAFTGYNYFTSIINSFALEVEETATELMETVTLQNALRTNAESTGNGAPTGVVSGTTV